jgi:hypothetical protein
MKRITVFLPDDFHERLRQDAFRTKVSMAELIRTKLRQSPERRSSRQSSKDPLLKVAGICRGPILSSEIDISLYGR